MEADDGLTSVRRGMADADLGKAGFVTSDSSVGMHVIDGLLFLPLTSPSFGPIKILDETCGSLQ